MRRKIWEIRSKFLHNIVEVIFEWDGGMLWAQRRPNFRLLLAMVIGLSMTGRAFAEDESQIEHAARRTMLTKPQIKDKVHSARWLVASSEWGVLATKREGGGVFSNVMSYSDGVYSQTDRENSTGVPYFYLTKMDESGRDLGRDATASFTISEKSADVDGRCGAQDAQEPTCAKITLMGRVILVKSRIEQEFAKRALFSKHPAMERWPQGHMFSFYKMDIHEIFFLNDYGGASPVRPSKYLTAKLSSDEGDDDGAVVGFEEYAVANERRLLRHHRRD